MKAIALRIGLLVFALTASCATVHPPNPGDAVLALAGKDYAAATEAIVRDRLQALMEHLQVDARTRALYLPNVAAAPAKAQAAPRLDKAEKMLKRSQATMAVIVAKNDVVLDHATDSVIIAGGHVKIGFATNTLVVATGSIVISHDGPGGGGGGMYVTRDRVEISHASRPIVYALRGVSFSTFSRVTAYNTDVREGGYGVVTRLTRPPIFAGEYARRPAPDSMAVYSGNGGSPDFAYTGSRCEQGVSEQSIEKVLRQAESKHACTSIESVNVVCVSNGGQGKPSVERWTVQLCGKSEVYEARTTRGTPVPGQVSGTAASISPLTPGPGMSAVVGISRASPKDSDELRTLFKAALEATAQGERARALELYGRIISSEPKYWSAYVNRAMLRAQQGDIKGAIDDCTTVIELGYANSDLFSMRGDLWLRGGEPERALQDLNAAIERGATTTALFNRGITYLNTGEPQRAVTDFSRVIERSPRHPDAYEMRMWAALLSDGNASGDATLRMSLLESAPGASPRARAAYAIVGGYLALRMKAQDDQARIWVTRWRGELRADAWPDALALHWVDEMDLQRVRAIAAGASHEAELDAFLGLQALAVADPQTAQRHFAAVLAGDASTPSLARSIAQAKPVTATRR
jgi:tetratricopeptide (TPR) repeat protein